MIRLSRFTTLFSRRGETSLITGLETQLDVTLEAAGIAAGVVDGTADLLASRQQMEVVEHRGDLCRAEFVEMLSRTLATPIDREDLFRLSRSIDDVLDSLRDFVRESHLYLVGDQTRLVPAIEDVALGITELRDAVHTVVRAPSHVVDHTLAARKAGNAVCRKYQYEIAHLFSDSIDAHAMKSRELARRLDIAGSRICEAADALADGVMKRWH